MCLVLYPLNVRFFMCLLNVTLKANANAKARSKSFAHNVHI